MTILATNYDGLMEGLALLATLLVAILTALAALVLSTFQRFARASAIAGNTALFFSCFSTLLLFVSVIPSSRSADNDIFATRLTLIAGASCTAATLLARGIAAWRASRNHDDSSKSLS